MATSLRPDPDAAVCPIVAAASSGDRRAIEQLYLLHRRAGSAFLRRKGIDDAEGTFDDVFVDVLFRLDAIDVTTTGEYGAYLYRSLRNRAIQQQRGTRATLVELDEFNEPSDPGRFEDSVVDRDLLATCLAELTDNQREVVSRRFIGNERSTEIAADLGQTPESVRQLQRSALLRLRFLLSVGAAVILALVVAALGLMLVRANVSEPTDPISSTDPSVPFEQPVTPPLDDGAEDPGVLTVPAPRAPSATTTIRSADPLAPTSSSTTLTPTTTPSVASSTSLRPSTTLPPTARSSTTTSAQGTTVVTGSNGQDGSAGSNGQAVGIDGQFPFPGGDGTGGFMADFDPFQGLWSPDLLGTTTTVHPEN